MLSKFLMFLKLHYSPVIIILRFQLIASREKYSRLRYERSETMKINELSLTSG